MGSTYVQNPPYFEGMTLEPAPIKDVSEAPILALFGDSITTDHISPAGSIKKASPAGVYLNEHQVAQNEFNSYGARRGNHQVMMRGTFANIRIKNAMVTNADGSIVEGGYTIHHPSGERMFIYDAAMRYQAEGKELVVFAGKEYGTGSSRDWAAKGTRLLGVRAVIAESFERIHRSNLIGMGVLPLQFFDGMSWDQLQLTGAETASIAGVGELTPRQRVNLRIRRNNGRVDEVEVQCRIDTENEVQYFRNGGILHYVLRGLAKPS
jgi:aconitate hydratase